MNEGQMVAALLLAARKRRPQTRGLPTLDGAVRHPTIGGGVLRHPLLEIYKDRAPRRWS